MYEVEVKVAADHDAVRENLPDDAAYLGTVEQVDTYFDAPHRDFAETDEALRIRSERSLEDGAGERGDDGGDDSDGEDSGGDDGNGEDSGGNDGNGDDSHGDHGADGYGEQTTALTYKGPLLEAESKTREEFESGLENGEAVEAALERLGFTPAATVRKERERFAVGEYTVTLDSVDGLGEYVEVETEQADDDVAAAREEALELLRELGCDPDEQIRTSYLGLLLAED